jgi:iron complex transport system substrate-binding protein
MEAFMKKLLAVLLIAMCAFCCFAQAQVEVQAIPETIVSLGPNVTEIIYALGAGDSLVGRTDYCNYPEEALSVQSVGTLYEPNLELIISLNPDIVIASSIVDPSFMESLEEAGIKTLQIVKEESLDGTFELISEIGSAIGKPTEALTFVASLKDRIAKVREVTSQIPENEKKSAVYIISWGDWGDYAATGDTYLNDVLEAAGAINAAQSASYWSISKELLIAQDPDVILLPKYSYSDPESEIAAFKSTEPYSNLKASLNNAVYSVNGDAAERQGVRTADTIEEIAKLLYPNLF